MERLRLVRTTIEGMGMLPAWIIEELEKMEREQAPPREEALVDTPLEDDTTLSDSTETDAPGSPDRGIAIIDFNI